MPTLCKRVWAIIYILYSLVPRLPDLYSLHGIKNHVSDVINSLGTEEQSQNKCMCLVNHSFLLHQSSKRCIELELARDAKKSL